MPPDDPDEWEDDADDELPVSAERQRPGKPSPSKGRRPPADPAAKWEKDLSIQFGPEFLNRLNENYEEALRTDRHVIYRPRQGPATIPSE